MDNPFEPHLLIREIDDIRVVELNHPDTFNSVDGPLHKALAEVWSHLTKDEAARAVVLTGNGRAFSAGGDFGLFQELLDAFDTAEHRQIVADFQARSAARR